MNILQGVVQTQKGTQGVFGLVVVAYGLAKRDQTDSKSSLIPLGSVGTDSRGRFEISFTFPENQEPINVLIGVLAPGGNKQSLADAVKFASNQRHPEFLFLATPRLTSANSLEAFSIGIENQLLEQAGIVLPESNTFGSRLALRTETKLTEIADTEKAMDVEFEKNSLPQFI